jgi:pyruvate/2-oxoglutarate dehydrogenase complex dihydrolipoamide dehydrogenase (E3) component
MAQSHFQNVNVSPMDDYNQELINQVHPPDWDNPQPVSQYDLVVIGAGTAGLVVAAGTAGLDVGLKVALIERNLLGGDCLNVGCVPSKAIIRSSRFLGEVAKSQNLGINVAEDAVNIDFPAVMARMRKVRTKISPHDSAQRFHRMGIDIFFGQARFTKDNLITVEDRILKFDKAVIATGGSPVHPKIKGIEAVGYLTNETVFSLTERPQRLAVIGGGPIGCELAQAFKRLGCEVILFHKHSHLLNKEDADAAEIVQNAFVEEGVNLVLNAKIDEVTGGEGGKTIHYTSNGENRTVTVDEILIGAGRSPNVKGLNLEAVGVEYDERHGVKIDDYLQTTHPKIYAVGDICMKWKFTHAADAAARIVIKNALFTPFGIGKDKLSDLVMPWVTYTTPEIAHVGMYEHEAQEKGIKVNTIKIDFNDLDRAIADGDEEGFLKIHHRQGSDEILGATIVAPHAGEMISEVTTAIVNKVGLGDLAQVIHPYPTQAEAIKQAADLYHRAKLTGRTKSLLRLLNKFA